MPYKSIKALSNLIVLWSQSGLKAERGGEWCARALPLPLQPSLRLCAGGQGGCWGGAGDPHADNNGARRRGRAGCWPSLFCLPLCREMLPAGSAVRAAEQRDAGEACAQPRWKGCFPRACASVQCKPPDPGHLGKMEFARLPPGLCSLGRSRAGCVELLALSALYPIPLCAINMRNTINVLLMLRAL